MSQFAFVCSLVGILCAMIALGILADWWGQD